MGTTQELMDIIVEFGSNLKALRLVFQRGTRVDRYQFWQNLAKMTKLRSLEVFPTESFGAGGEQKFVNKKLNVDGLTFLLKTCTKLKYFHFVWWSDAEIFATQVEKEPIRRVVANKSYRQMFVVIYRWSGNLLQSIKVKLAGTNDDD